MSSLGIFNKETKTYQKVAGTAEAAVVDAEMSDTSTNTVQNKVIKKYVDDSNTTKLDKTSVVDNQLTSEAGYALDARQANPNVEGSLGAQIKTVNETVDTLKKSVSDGKTKVANAITDKGVETATDATFDVMAENISKIETGGGELHGATISVTTTEETLVGMTITLSLNDTVVATRTFDDNGACSFTDIQEAGVYSLHSTDGTDSNTIPVDITAENVINKTVISCEFYLTPDGETVTPVNDVAILLKCAEIKGKSYTTIDELLADGQAMGDITMSENAMKYLARSTGFADAVCADETFMTLLGASSYVDATVLNSDLWFNKCLESQYSDKVFKDIRTIHAGAYETITMSFTNRTITTNSDGNVNFPIPNGTYTFTGSVSGESFTRTVASDTKDVYVMPEGALYWYGSTTRMCGNIVASTYGLSNVNNYHYIAPILAYNTNSLTITYKPDQSGYCSGSVYFGTTPKVYDGYTKICMEYDNYVTNGDFHHTASAVIAIANAYGTLPEENFIIVSSKEQSYTLELEIDDNHKYPVIIFNIYDYTGNGSLSFNVKKLWLE